LLGDFLVLKLPFGMSVYLQKIITLSLGPTKITHHSYAPTSAE
jgi:hypothetical protein